MNELADYFALHYIFVRIFDVFLYSKIQGLVFLFLCLFRCFNRRHNLLQYGSYVSFKLSLSPSSAVQNLKVNYIRELRFKSGDFLHYIFNYFRSIGQKNLHPLQQNLQFF